MIELTTAGFSSPTFGDMFLLDFEIEKEAYEISFSSPLFGDMFLLKVNAKELVRSYKFSSPIFGDMFLLLFDQLVDISTIIDIFNGTLNGQ